LEHFGRPADNAAADDANSRANAASIFISRQDVFDDASQQVG